MSVLQNLRKIFGRMFNMEAKAYSEGRSADKRVEFTEEELRILKGIVQRDDFMKQMAKSQKGLEFLNDIASKSITGPLKFAWEWNSAVINAWGIANKNLGSIAKTKTCSELSLLESGTTDTKKTELFQQMQRVRRCNSDALDDLFED